MLLCDDDVLLTHLFFPDRIDLENVWGHVNLYARGAGQAVAQLDVNYGVDFEPFKVSRKFSLFSVFEPRNKNQRQSPFSDPLVQADAVAPDWYTGAFRMLPPG